MVYKENRENNIKADEDTLKEVTQQKSNLKQEKQYEMIYEGSKSLHPN